MFVSSRRACRLSCWLVATMAAVVPPASRAADPPVSARPISWPQWRGPDGQGHAPTARDLPIQWSDQQNVAWKTVLPGRGWSSPVMDEATIWMTSAEEVPPTEEEKRRRTADSTNPQQLNVAGRITLHALGVARDSGKIVAQIRLFEIPNPDPIHSLNSYASPSPLLEDGRLYCHFGTNGTACVDTRTQQIVWANQELHLQHENGPGSTPVLYRDWLIVHCDGSDVQFLAALDKRTGKLAWRTERSGTLNSNPQMKKAYGTPLVVTLEGRDVLLSPAADWLYAYDPATGRELWKLNYGVLGFSVVPRPVAAHGLLYMSTSFMQAEVLAVRLGDGTSTPEIAWRSKKGAPQMPSPLVVGDELYLINDKGIATCLDARSGMVHWSERLGGNFCSSPLLADGRIYVGNREGQVFVLAPGKTFQLLATNTTDGAVMATPAAVERALYVRTEHALYRIEKR
ncbi:MAG: PQQ-binding-like beta-propeller repeat protein [Pirellulales bacterium]